MYIKTLQFAGLAVALFLGACSNETIQEIGNETASVEFKIVSDIQKITRTPNLNEQGAGSFIDGDQNTVFFQSSQNSLLHNMEYTYGQTYYWFDLPLPVETKECLISACYPKVTTESPENFEWDVTTNSASNDFLMAAPVKTNTNSTTPVALTFKHALHKLTVELQADNQTIDEEVLNQATVTCQNFQPIATLNLLQGKAVKAKGTLSQLTEKGKKTAFILPAQELGSMELKIQLGNRIVKCALADCQIRGTFLKALESGHSVNLVIKVSKDGFSVSGQDIEGWADQGTFEGNIVL